MSMPVFEGVVRRLPVYFLIDCSEVLAGEPLQAVQRLLEDVQAHLLDDPQTREAAHVSLIRFSEMAAQAALEDVDSLTIPLLEAAPGRSFGAALHLLRASLAQDLIATTPTQRGDYYPIVFVVLAGPPTDSYAEEVQALRRLNGPQRPTIIGLAAQPAATAPLRTLTDHVLELPGVTATSLSPFFTRVTDAIISSSQGVLPADQPPPVWLGNPLNKSL